VGFSVVVPITCLLHELDGLFVDPSHMSSGIGRALVEDAAVRASNQGAEALEVTAGPAQSFYERVGFRLIGAAQTRFGPAVRICAGITIGDQGPREAYGLAAPGPEEELSQLRA
jgi:ribosomal protein S18 acetylase RimI-like enzyme